VATDPASRGQGLASVCVERCLQKARAAGASVAVLWGSEHKLYGRLGFRLAGVQLLGPLGAIEVGNSEQLNNTGKAPKLHEGWVPALFDLIAGERTRGLILQERDRTWFSQHRHTHWYWLGKDSRHPLAYAAINRGIDLPGIMHEWGGEADALRVLLASLASRFPATQLLAHPDILKTRGMNFKVGASVQREYLCLACDLGKEPGGFAQIEKQLWFWGLDGA
ncbi:MAG: GNAT family N-acetyltransferase, partial [Bdellovibrionota bacterium]